MPILNLRRFSAFLLVPLLLAFLGACASSPPESKTDFKADYDFTKIQVLSFNKPTTSGDSDKVFLSDMQINRINDALAKTLESKGFKIVLDDAQADARIHWHLAAQEKTRVSTHTEPGFGSYGGYGPYGRYNRAALYNCWNCGSTVVDVREYTEGTFIVDIIDPTLKQSVWRSVTQSRLKGDGLKDTEALNAAAQSIMAAFPPGLPQALTVE